MKVMGYTIDQQAYTSLADSNRLSQNIRKSWQRTLESESLNLPSSNSFASFNHNGDDSSDIGFGNLVLQNKNIKTRELTIDDNVGIQAIIENHEILSCPLNAINPLMSINFYKPAISPQASLAVISAVANRIDDELILPSSTSDKFSAIDREYFSDSRIFIISSNGIATVWIRDYKNIIGKSEIHQVIEFIKQFLLNKGIRLAAVMLNTRMLNCVQP